MKKFEYLVLSYNRFNPCVKEGKIPTWIIAKWKLEELGNEGWEMCGCSNIIDDITTVYYFKREIDYVIK